MILNFIRHGKTQLNLLKRVSGSRIDVGLSSTGADEIRKYKEDGGYPMEPGRCFTSDLKRTQETFELIYPGKSYTPTKVFRERDFGPIEWETDIDLINQWRDSLLDSDGTEHEELFYDGESSVAFRERFQRDLQPFFEKMFEEHVERVTICGHGSYLREWCISNRIASVGNHDISVRNGKGVTFQVTRETPGIFYIEIVGFIGGSILEEVTEHRER